jgi:membrane associated rhomboid family serine protease
MPSQQTKSNTPKAKSSRSNSSSNNYLSPWWVDNDDDDDHHDNMNLNTNGGRGNLVGDDDIDNVSTSSSLYIEDSTQPEEQEPPVRLSSSSNQDKGTRKAASQRSSNPTLQHHSSSSSPTRSSPTTQRQQQPKLQAWKDAGQAKVKNAVEYMQHQVSPSSPNSSRNKNIKSESRNSSDRNSKSSRTAVFQWDCEACTYANVKSIALTTNGHPTMSHLTCEVCGTPHAVLPPSRTRSGTTTMDATTTTTPPPRRSSSSTSNTNNYHHRATASAAIDLPVDPVEAIERSLQMDQENEIATAAAAASYNTSSSNNHRHPSQSASTASRTSKNNKLSFHVPVWQQLKQQTTAADPPTTDVTGGEQAGSGHTRELSNSDGISETSIGTHRQYSVHELIASLGDEEVELPPALERRVRDFKFAQAKRKEKHGDQKAWGIYGLYAHLSDIRADLEWAEDAAWRRQRGQPYLSWKDFDKSRDKGLHNRPLFTYGILFLCTIMMFVTFGVNGWKFEPLNVNPLIGPSSETLIQCGARDTELIINDGQWFRLFSPLILHAGLIHYVMNMMALYFIGGAVEQSHGFASAAVLFIIPAVGGNILSAICLPQYISVGASGGIFGMIGGCIADISLNWNLLFLKTATDGDTRNRHFYVLLWLGLDIVLNCILGFTPLVDNFTHL